MIVCAYDMARELTAVRARIAGFEPVPHIVARNLPTMPALVGSA